ncbi:hypothetical protein [Burkholderia gladioli]|uniref:hypothetical protein n=1 Tax=Burkholderia gladioli TaxID=28095 RepID=UPI001640D7B9|nr:hypothetical protein [Burkholderia gladioli]
MDLKSLHAKLGELTPEKVFLEGALTKAGVHRLVQPETASFGLADRTPNEAYLETLPAIKSAA